MPKSINILLRNAYTAIDLAVRAELTQHGFSDITPSQFALLRNLGEDGSRPSELAKHAGVTRQAITKLVDELEQLDLVHRVPDPDDGRGVIVRYTDRGLNGLELARRRALDLEAEYAARVGADRWTQLRTTLETLFDDDLHEAEPTGRKQALTSEAEMTG